jgi:tetrahydromethanopterin S-methyltransferase subunit A
MSEHDAIQKIRAELELGTLLAKCKKCGCMKDALDDLAAHLPNTSVHKTQGLAQELEVWIRRMEPAQYACQGCTHCYPAVAANAFANAFPSAVQAPSPSCDFRLSATGWPLVVGEYIVLEQTASVAVSTLASVELVERLADHNPMGLAIVGKTETENIGIDKVVKNIITNPSIHYLVVAGVESYGHESGKTLLAVSQNGIDDKGRVIGAPGKRPILRNVSREEVECFREQVGVIDMVGCADPEVIGLQVEALASKAEIFCDGVEPSSPHVYISTIPREPVSNEPDQVVKMDKAGYFVIIPLADDKKINVEHYAYDNTLLHVVEGATAESLYKTIIANGWVTELSHAAYLGKELMKAVLSLQFEFKYVQDSA